jgi:hypothetical protein
MANPIESKVVAAATGSGVGAAAGTFVLWVMGITIWHVPNTADRAAEAVGAIPSPVSTLVLVVIAAIGSAVGGWLAPHTHLRPPPSEPITLQETSSESG